MVNSKDRKVVVYSRHSQPHFCCEACGIRSLPRNDVTKQFEKLLSIPPHHGGSASTNTFYKRYIAYFCTVCNSRGPCIWADSLPGVMDDRMHAPISAGRLRCSTNNKAVTGRRQELKVGGGVAVEIVQERHDRAYRGPIFSTSSRASVHVSRFLRAHSTWHLAYATWIWLVDGSISRRKPDVC